MQSPSIGTYALSFLLAGVGGWAVSQSLQDHQAPAPAAVVAPANPAPVNVTIVNPGSGGPAVATGAVATYAASTGSGATSVRGGGTTEGRVTRTQPATAHRGPAAARAHRAHAAAPQRRTALSPVGQLLLAPSVLRHSGGTNIIASNGAIVYVGDNGHLIANTGQVASSGVVALGVNGSQVGSGDSLQTTRGGDGQPAASTQSAAATAGVSDANGSFASIGSASGGFTSVAVSGFEDHSVSVIGDNQITTYDDSNVFINRDGNINANTGDTDSSGLNVVDVTGSIVRSGNSGDGEGAEGEDSDDAAATPAATPAGTRADADAESSVSSDEQDGGDDDQGTTSTGPQGNGASVTDEGTSSATGGSNMVIGADGYDDVSIRSHGNGNITSYDDSNVVIGGHGDVNAQIGDSDTGGAVVMGVHNSNVQAGCEGDLCYTGSHR